MHEFKRLAHAVWDCKYHIVWCPKYRFQILQGEVGQSMRAIIRELCRQKQIEILEGNVQVDHIHLVMSIPPKYSVSYAVGFLKGKSAVRVHREILQERRLTGLHFWAPGYCVSIVGLDERTIREYIQQQEKLETGQRELDFK